MDYLKGIHHVARIRRIRHALRRGRVFRDMTNPQDIYDDVDFIQRYRLNRQTVMHIVNLIDDIGSQYATRVVDISPTNKILMSLRFYVAGSMKRVISDVSGISVASANRTIYFAS